MAERTIEERTYPIGIQSFPRIIEGGYAYVDKTFFVGKLVKESNEDKDTRKLEYRIEELE